MEEVPLHNPGFKSNHLVSLAQAWQVALDGRMSTRAWRSRPWAPHSTAARRACAQRGRRALPWGRKQAVFSLVLLPQGPAHRELQPVENSPEGLSVPSQLKEPQTSLAPRQSLRKGERGAEKAPAAHTPCSSLGAAQGRARELDRPPPMAPAPLCAFPNLSHSSASSPAQLQRTHRPGSAGNQSLEYMRTCSNTCLEHRQQGDRWRLYFFPSLLPGPQGPWSAQGAPVRSQPKQSRNPLAGPVPGPLRAHSGSGGSPGSGGAGGVRRSLRSGSAPMERNGSIAIATRSAPSSGRLLPPGTTAGFVFSFVLSSAPSALFFPAPREYCEPHWCYFAFCVLCSSSRRVLYKKFSPF